jgi:hypothetical protein
MLLEEGDLRVAQLVAVVLLESGQGDFQVERHLLALLRRLHRERDADGLVAQRAAVMQRPRPPRGRALQVFHLRILEAGRAREVENVDHVIVRDVAVLLDCLQARFLRQVLDEGIAHILRCPREQVPERRQHQLDEPVMLRHVHPERAQRQLAFAHLLKEGMVLGVPLFADRDDLLDDGGRGQLFAIGFHCFLLVCKRLRK